MSRRKETHMGKDKDDIFSDENEVKANYWKLEKVGDEVRGVLVDKRIVQNTLRTPAVRQTIYTLIQDDETPICIGGRGGQDPQVIAGLEQCKMGQYVGLKYVEEKKNSKPGLHPAKIVRVYTNGTMKQDVLDKYKGVSEADVLPDEENPFED